MDHCFYRRGTHSLLWNNNILKLILLGRHTDRFVVLRFGAGHLGYLPRRMGFRKSFGIFPVDALYLFGFEFEITSVKVTMSILLIFFTLLELIVKDGGLRQVTVA